MKTLLTVAVLMLTGCGGSSGSYSGAADVRVVNDYAESLFTVRVEGADGGQTSVCEGARISTKQTFKDALHGAHAEPIKLQVSVMSLGEVQSFPDVVETFSPGDVLELTYDYDLATAKFMLKHGWENY